MLGIFFTMTVKIRNFLSRWGGGFQNAKNNVPLLRTAEESGRSLSGFEVLGF